MGIRWIAFAPPGRGKGLPTQFLFQVTPRTHNLATALSAPVVLVILAGRVVSLFVCLRCFGKLTLMENLCIKDKNAKLLGLSGRIFLPPGAANSKPGDRGHSFSACANSLRIPLLDY